MTRCSSSLRALLMTAVSAAVLALASPAVAQVGFSISVDGTHVAGDPVAPDTNRRNDVALAAADIRVSFDGLGAKPTLNVAPLDRRVTYGAGEPIALRVEANYRAWIERTEIRVLSADGRKVVATLPGELGDDIVWTMPADGPGDYLYVARVYDRNGRYDETEPLPLRRGAQTDNTVDDLPVWGDDRTARRNISIDGGIVTVYGDGLPRGAQVNFLGQSVPVDGKGAFVAQRILPAGDHTIEVAVDVPKGQGMVFTRYVNIPSQDWFYVGMADLTVGKRWGDAGIAAVKPGEFDDVYMKGRAAFYLKGKVKGEYLLTASADTGEGPLDELFTGVLSSDPQAVLRRIDPNQYYPVYGDDSELVDDAPTRGKLYVRLERGESSVMWGTFRTVVGNSSLLRAERVLYGAAARIESDDVTAGGLPVYEASAYAAQPGTLPARDVLRGTGGSAYVLRRQDVVPGSETITVERRDAVSGLVVSTTSLRAGVDYTINYLQGMVMLARPLSSVERSSGAVQSAHDDVVMLVVQYEYSPPNVELDDMAFGGSGTVRLGDLVSVGVVGLAEQHPDVGDLAVYGANVRIAPTERTYLAAEVLHSEGAASPSWLSTDGGLTYVQQPAVGPAGGANAYRLEGQVALDELVAGSFDAIAGFAVEAREAGFATPGQQVPHDTLAARAYVDAQLTEQLAFGLDYAHLSNATGARRDELETELTYKLDDDWTVSAGILHHNEARPGGTPAQNGWRTDVGGRVTFGPSDDLSLYGFGQLTVAHSPGFGRNDRVGLGADLALAQGWSLAAEGSIGTTGPEASVLLGHESEPGSRSYVGVRASSSEPDDFFAGNRALSGVVLGTEQRLNDVATVRAENIYGLFDDRGSTTGVYGVELRPDAKWRGSASYEAGHIEDPLASDFDRKAVSLALSYDDGDIAWRSRGEFRLEDSLDNSRDRATALLQAGLSVKTDDDWRVLAGFDGLFSRSDQSAILDGDYVEASVGAAYRPVDHDRLNALFRYTYLYDLPGPDQVSRGGGVLGPAQRSHILSVDANYDITPELTVGAKYGVRIGEVSVTRNSADFIASTVHLGVVRGDLAVLSDWHVLVEGRALYQQELDVLDLGALGMLSYDVSKEMRVGVGYNFGRFSDDLRDVTFDDHGVFFNMAAKF